MVAQSADEAVGNANATSTCSPGYCLWQTQEWCESPHVYPDATSQWHAAAVQHPGDTDPPAGAPVFWTGGSHGYGHAALSVGGGMVRSTDQQSTGKVSTVPIAEIHSDWGLIYGGWTEDIGGVALPYLSNGGQPTNPNNVEVGEAVLVVAQGVLNGRAAPDGTADVVTNLPYGACFVVAAVQDGWAQESQTIAQQRQEAVGAVVPVLATDYLACIDLSSNNEEDGAYDWRSDTDWQFGWVKCTEGTSYVNEFYADQIAVIRERSGGIGGHYVWINADHTADEMVDWFAGHADVVPGDLIAVDWEDSSNPSTALKDATVEALQDRYTDCQVGLYCNRDWWLNHDTSSFFGDYLWIAVYDADDPGIQADWLFWQHTSSPYDKTWGRFANLDALKEWAGFTGADPAPDPDPDPDPVVTGGAWFSTEYLWPKITPDPTNPHEVKKGDTVEVTANGGLTARTLPGGPPTVGSDGEVLVRPTGYQFDVTGDLVDGWVTGGSNWYSSDFLALVTAPPAPTKPGWDPTPAVVLPMKDVSGSVSYLQGVAHVAAGPGYGECWILAQDLNDSGDPRFLLYSVSGVLKGWMVVKGAGHCQTFHAYQSAAGNLYLWCGEDPAYRVKWQGGKTVSLTSGDKMDYHGARPMGGYTDRVAFRDASDTKETFSIFDRTDFTGNVNRSKPIKTVTVTKRTSMSQQSWAANESRIYRIMGSTNEDTEHDHNGLHILDVFDWSGTLLLDRFDLTDMHRSGCTEDEPEGLAFADTEHGTGVIAFKREGPSSASKRNYVGWSLTGLP